MIKSWLGFFLLICTVALGWAAQPAQMSPNAVRLSQFLDDTGVEQLWPAGQHVDWETGIPDGKPISDKSKHTHCSAFVASVAKRLGVYILRPPEHSARLLANAQYDWLMDAGNAEGWRELDNGLQAQRYANRGSLVVAAYRNHHDDKPGHIAIVRPSDKSAEAIEQEGPQITQAGNINYLSTTLKQGFAGHPAAWKKHEVRYFTHALVFRFPDHSETCSSCSY